MKGFIINLGTFLGTPIPSGGIFPGTYFLELVDDTSFLLLSDESSKLILAQG